MNVSKLKPTDWMVVAGGVLVLIFGLLKWFSWDVKTENVVVVSGKSNAFDYLLTGVLPWLLVVGSAVVTLLLATATLRREGVPWPLVVLAATLLGTVLLIIRLIVGPDVDTAEGASVDSSRGIGLWLSAFGGIIATVGSFLSYQAGAFDSRTGLSGNNPRPDREIPPPTS